MNDEELRKRTREIVEYFNEEYKGVEVPWEKYKDDFANAILSLIKSNSSATLTTSRIEWLKELLGEKLETDTHEVGIIEAKNNAIWNNLRSQILENAKKDSCERHCTREIIEGCGECKKNHSTKFIGKTANGEDIYFSEG